MTFEEILDQAIAMLRRRGRMTYRTLRLQFQRKALALCYTGTHALTALLS